jgi:hypothetical protein
MRFQKSHTSIVHAKNGLWGVAEQDEIKRTTKEERRRTGVVASKFRH